MFVRFFSRPGVYNHSITSVFISCELQLVVLKIIVSVKYIVRNIIKSISLDVTTHMTVQTGQTRRTARHARPVSVMMMSSSVRSVDVSPTYGNVIARPTARMDRTRRVVVSQKLPHRLLLTPVLPGGLLGPSSACFSSSSSSSSICSKISVASNKHRIRFLSKNTVNDTSVI